MNIYIGTLTISIDMFMVLIGFMTCILVLLGLRLIYSQFITYGKVSTSKVLTYLPTVNVIIITILTLIFGVDII
jgi:hypothetical protein